jgi:NADH:ubiquinone oxidoreductase subunit H
MILLLLIPLILIYFFFDIMSVVYSPAVTIILAHLEFFSGFADLFNSKYFFIHLKSLIFFIFIVLVRITTPRFRLESLSKLG